MLVAHSHNHTYTRAHTVLLTFSGKNSICNPHLKKVQKKYERKEKNAKRRQPEFEVKKDQLTNGLRHKTIDVDVDCDCGCSASAGSAAYQTGKLR